MVADALSRASVEPALNTTEFQDNLAMDAESWWLQTTGDILPDAFVGEVIAAMPDKRTEWRAEQLKDQLCMNVEAKLVSGENLSFAVKGFPRYGKPRDLVSDNAPQCFSNVVEELCQRWGLFQKRISIYHAVGPRRTSLQEY